MIHLLNKHQNFDILNYLEIFLKGKPPDCIIYSEDGIEFQTYKELFSQTKFMRELLNSANCCGVVEIIFPCSKEELGHLMNFINEGKIEYNKKVDFLKIVENLDKILGFSPDFINNVFPNTFLKEHNNVETFNKSKNLENYVIKRRKSLATSLNLKQDSQGRKKLDITQNSRGEENFDVEMLPESQNNLAADEASDIEDENGTVTIIDEVKAEIEQL